MTSRMIVLPEVLRCSPSNLSALRHRTPRRPLWSCPLTLITREYDSHPHSARPNFTALPVATAGVPIVSAPIKCPIALLHTCGTRG